MKLNFKKIFHVAYHIIKIDIKAMVRIILNPTETWYVAWKVKNNNGNIAGKEITSFTRQAVMFDGTEQIDVIPYPHRTVKGNCLVEVYSKDTRPYYFGNGFVYIRYVRLSKRYTSRYIEFPYNRMREEKLVYQAVGEMYPEYKNIKFKLTGKEYANPISFM